jgi:hypothetical protein
LKVFYLPNLRSLGNVAQLCQFSEKNGKAVLATQKSPSPKNGEDDLVSRRQKTDVTDSVAQNGCDFISGTSCGGKNA